MTSLFNITQEKTTVIRVHYHEASTPFPTNQLELCNAQNCDDKLQPLIQYLKDGTLPKSALTAEKIMWQEGQYFFSDYDILYSQSLGGKRTVIWFGSIKNLTNTALTQVPWPFHKWSPWFKQNVWTSEIHIVLEQHVCRFTILDQILCFLCPEEKRCSPLKAISPAHSSIGSMRSYCRRLYGPSSTRANCHKFRKSIHSFCWPPLYKVYQNRSSTFNWNCYHHPGVFG